MIRAPENHGSESWEVLQSEVTRLREMTSAFTEALRSVEAMAWYDIAPTSDIREICQSLVGKIQDTGNIRQMGVFLTNPETFEFSPGLMVPEESADRIREEFEKQLAGGMIGWTVRERRLTAVPSLTAPQDGEDGRSVIIFPISTTRQVWGIAICFTAYDTDELPQNALRLLNIVANHFGMALENASLLNELTGQNRDLEVEVQKRTAELSGKNKALEEAYEELRKVDSAKDDFISLVAHELRTPLTSILSFSEFLGEEGLSPEEVKEFSTSIRQEATRLHLLVNDVLDLAKMEAGKLTYRYSEEDINTLVDLCVNGMAGHAAKRNIELRIEKDEKTPPISLAPDRIQQVLQNMISNAIKYSEENTQVTVVTRDEPDSVRVEVRDQGMGIAARDIPKVFNKFERIEDVKHHAGGTGFGMPVAKSIIEAGHGGKMWVESEGRGKGAVFYFILPKSRGPNRESGSAISRED